MKELFSPIALSVVVGVLIFIVAYVNANRFLEWLRWQSIGNRDYIVETMAKMFIEVSPNRILLYMILTSLVPALLLFLLILPQIIPATIFSVAAGVLFWFLPKAVVNQMFQRRVTKFNFQMIDGLSLMANGMKSGLSIIQAMGMVKAEMPNPLSQEFDYVLRQNQLGVSVEEAFQNLAKRIPSEDVNMFVTAIVILKETGGNLAETFETIVYTIRERIKVEQKIAAMVAQGVAQGVIVFCMPFGLGIMFYLSDPGLITPLFTNPLGWLMTGVMLTLQFVGGFVILKVVQIRV
jgi:tight adherence protein B